MDPYALGWAQTLDTGRHAAHDAEFLLTTAVRVTGMSLPTSCLSALFDIQPLVVELVEMPQLGFAVVGEDNLVE